MGLRCKECSLYKTSRIGLDYSNFIEGKGNKKADLMFVMDFPFIEDISNDEFLSSSKNKLVLEKLINKLGYSLEDVYITTLVKCRPADTTKKPNKPYITKCTTMYLHKEIEEIQPKVIVTIGKYSSAQLVEGLKTLEQAVGSVFINTQFNTKVIPLFNLNYIQGLNKQSKQYKNSIKALLEIKKSFTGNSKKDEIYISEDVNDLHKLKELVGVDLETAGLDQKNDKVFTIGISDIETTLSFDVGCKGIPWKEIQKCLSTKKLVYQNGTFDLGFHKTLGHNDLLAQLFLDTRNCQYLLEPYGANSLGFMAQMYCGVELKDCIDRENMDEADPEERRIYCGYDAYYTIKILKEKLEPKIKEMGMGKSARIRSYATVIATELEYNGIRFDTFKAKQIREPIEVEKFLCEEKFRKAFKLEDDFNLNSDKQLAKLFFEDLGLPIKVTTPKGAPSVNAKAIEGLVKHRKTVQHLLDYRTQKGELEKVEGYIKATTDDGRIYGSFNLFSPNSLRFMGSKPNYQNCKRDSLIKTAFVPKEGYSYVYFDFAQLEYRLWIAIANDKNGIKFINEGKDIHRFIASKVFNKAEKDVTKDERDEVKSIVYGLLYGNTPDGVSYLNDIPLELAEDVHKIFFSICKTGYKWIKDTERLVQQQGWVATPFGARRTFPNIKNRRGRSLRHALNEALNFPIQSWGNELGVISAYKCLQIITKLNIDAKLVHQIHDAFIFETKDEDIEQMKMIVDKYASNPIKLSVPLPVDIKVGKSWAEL